RWGIRCALHLVWFALGDRDEFAAGLDYSFGVMEMFIAYLSSRIMAGAKNRAADADFGGAFFDGDFEIAAHSHGQSVQLDAVDGGVLQVVAQHAQRAKTVAHGL